MKGYFSGTSGLVLPQPNKQAYPPEFQSSSRLTYYAHLFSSIEINSTFYKLPRPATVLNWAGSTPESFRFTFKLWRDITHTPQLKFRKEDLAAFLTAIEPAGNRRGTILVQFPPGLRYTNLLQVGHLLEAFEEMNTGWPVAVEFRHASWYREETYQLLQEFRAAFVLHDKAGAEAPFESPSARVVYQRFHGPGGNYKGSYDDGFLYEFAGYIREWIAEDRDVYLYFDNTAGDAVGNLLTLNRYVQEE